VPKPLNFCLHKLVIAQRRAKKDKREKDIQQAVYILAILDPKDLRFALVELPPKRRQLARKSLEAAWDLFPLERSALARHGLTPQKLHKGILWCRQAFADPSRRLKRKLDVDMISGKIET